VVHQGLEGGDDTHGHCDNELLQVFDLLHNAEQAEGPHDAHLLDPQAAVGVHGKQHDGRDHNRRVEERPRVCRRNRRGVSRESRGASTMV
jgi:hypothetical protein